MNVSNELEEKIQKMLAEGREDEVFVKNILEKEGYNVIFADKEEDMYKHIDLWVEHDNVKRGIGIDVKGRKKNRQKDKQFNDKIHWIELQNVNGHKGWLYGKAKMFAFRTNDNVIFVRQKDLIKLVENKIYNNYYVTDCPKECYVLYKRIKWDRNDLTIKVPVEDLINIASSIYDVKNDEFKYIKKCKK